MNHVTVTGQRGEIRWGYYTAAVLTSWTVTGDALTATVGSFDSVRVSQHPLMLIVPRPSGEWRWELSELQIAGDTLMARVSAKE